MTSLTALDGGVEELRKKIIMTVSAVLLLMALFPPKTVVVTNPLFDQKQTTPAGYTFLFSDPAAEQKANGRMVFGNEIDKYIGSSIEWPKLLLQMLVTVGVGVAVTRILRRQPDHAT
jgi:hypothetical protein